MNAFRRRFFTCFLMLLSGTGCSSLLPHSTQTNELPWSSYQQAQQVFDSITPEKTTLAELHRLGIHPEHTPNVSLLNHTDVMRRLAITANLDLQFLPPQVQKCIASHHSCHAYEIEQKHLDHQRHGNFWMDFLNFRRQTNTLGWQFDALIIMQDDLVVYKLWSGKPNILLQEEERSPLGPLQGIGTTQWRR
ncbi:MAG: hypothetical protein NTY70_18220 [Burkholderiales bacterium]|nr:hypothetical protein [Burkholderiales bacterium]